MTLAGVVMRLGTRAELLLSCNHPMLVPMSQRPSLASPYLAGVLALVQSRTHHAVGDHAGVECLTFFGAQESDPGAAQALVVLH